MLKSQLLLTDASVYYISETQFLDIHLAKIEYPGPFIGPCPPQEQGLSHWIRLLEVLP